MLSIQNNFRFNKYKKFILDNYIIFIFSIIYFLMLCTFINSGHFIDENDNFLGALMVANGRDIYKFHISQHMPFAYYFFAIPAYLFKITTVPAFRISFYIIMILIWILIYFRYKNKFGKNVVLLYPILYIFSMSFFENLGCSAVSDQFQAQGLVILFLEFLFFLKTHEITWKTSVFVSLAVVLSFGTTFVSIFPIFVIAVAVLYLEIKYLFKEKISFMKWPRYFIKKYWHMLVIIALPFVLLISWYAITDNLYNFYFGAYKINRIFYPKYVHIGGNIIKDIVYTIVYYNGMLKNNFVSFFTNGFISLKFIAFIAINISFCIIFFKKKKELVVFVIGYILMCGIRGFEDFHSMGYYSITFIMLCILFKEYFLDSFKNKRATAYALICILFATFSVQFFGGIDGMLEIKSAFKNEDYIKEGNVEFIIDKLTKPNEPIFVSSLDIEIFIRAKRLPNYTPSTPVPWMWKAYKKKDFDFLNTQKPKVLYHNDNYEVLGNKLKDYAPDFINYVKDNYVVLSDKYPNLLVRKEFLPEAKKILNTLN